MSKKKILESIAAAAGIPRTKARQAYEAFLEELVQQLRSDSRAVVPGMGVVTVVERGPRLGRNPRTGEEIMIKARNVLRWRVAKSFKDRVHSPS